MDPSRGPGSRGGGAHDAADQGGEQGGGSGFAADVAEDDGGAVGAVVEEVVEVAADGAGGQEVDGHLRVGMRWRGGREQAELDSRAMAMSFSSWSSWRRTAW